MNETITAGNPIHGLTLLMSPTRNTMSIDSCCEHSRQHVSHPFDLQVPSSNFQRYVRFVGAGDTDANVEIFLANIRFHVGTPPEVCLKELIVISTPFPCKKPNQHYVFFEIRTPGMIILSGETTDFSGAGNYARQQLEDVFALLSLVNKVEIQRVTLKKEVSFYKLNSGLPTFGRV